MSVFALTSGKKKLQEGRENVLILSVFALTSGKKKLQEGREKVLILSVFALTFGKKKLQEGREKVLILIFAFTLNVWVYTSANTRKLSKNGKINADL